MLAGALSYYWIYRFNIFYADDFVLYPGLIPRAEYVEQGRDESFLEWLWALHGDHRQPLTKLIWFAELKVLGDPRVGGLVHVLGFGALACAMICVVRSIRGRASFADAFFPLAMLHVAQGFNFTWAACITGVLPSVLEGALILMLVRHGAGVGTGRAVLFGVCVFLLALSDTGGLPFAVALVAWLAYWGVRRWRSAGGGGARDLIIGVAPAAAVMVLLVLYFLDYRKPADPRNFQQYEGPKPGVDTTIKAAVRVPIAGFSGMKDSSPEAALARATLKFFSVSLGDGVRLKLGGDFIPVWQYAGTAVFWLLAASLVVVGVAWWRQPRERLRALGLFLAMGTVFPLVLAVARGRALDELSPMFHWYVVLGLPALSCAFLAWQLYAKPAAPLFQMCLFTLACIMLPLNTITGLQMPRAVHETMEAFERDLRRGTPPVALAQQYLGRLFDANADPETVAELMRRLRQAGIRPYQFMNDPGSPVAAGGADGGTVASPSTVVAGMDDGWPLYAVPGEGFAVALPPTWGCFDMDAEKFDAHLQATLRQKPELASFTAIAREHLAGGNRFFGVDVPAIGKAFPTMVLVARPALPAADFVQATVTELGKSPGTVLGERRRVKLKHGEAEEIQYTKKEDSSAFTVSLYVLTQPGDGPLLVLTILTDRPKENAAVLKRISDSVRFLDK
jgi:hypothetical protein